MRTVEPADFYTGIVAELYAPLKSAPQSPEPYARFIERCGEPALELGCGDGDPLLDLRRQGLDVEGVDSSPDMLARCRGRAAAEDLHVVVHLQRIEELDLPGRYRSIFLAGPTFNLLPDDGTVLQALQRIRAHLDEGGTALIPLFIPEPTQPSALGRVREAVASDGATLRVSAVSEDRDEDARTQCTVLRYERHAAGEDSLVEDRPWLLHWHTQAGFEALVTDAGLRTSSIRDSAGGPAADDASEFVFVLRHAT
jgi:SAM-dependent methyltransferase